MFLQAVPPLACWVVVWGGGFHEFLNGDIPRTTMGPSNQVWLQCKECGGTFVLSASSVCRYQREGREPVCRDCRRPQLSEARQVQLRAWWLKHYTREELTELGRMLWPDAP